MGDHTAASALFLDLHSNSDKDSPPSQNDAPPSMPTFVSSGGNHRAISGEYVIGNVDINKVEGVIIKNSFSDVIAHSETGKTESIYLLASLVNHSCHGTAVRVSVGSIMTMRASRNLKEGEEITCSFVGGADGATYLTREPGLKKWSINCQCELCLADRKDGFDRCRQREGCKHALNELRMKLRPGDLLQMSVAQQLVNKIRSTYASKRAMHVPMDTLGLAQRVLGFTYQVFDPKQAVQAYNDALRSHGINVKSDIPKRIPQNYSQLRRDSLIIGTKNFPSQRDYIFRCMKVMATLAGLEDGRGNQMLASHWAVACLWSKSRFTRCICVANPKIWPCSA